MVINIERTNAKCLTELKIDNIETDYKYIFQKITVVILTNIKGDIKTGNQ